MPDQSQTYRIGVSGMRRGLSLALACQTVGGADVTALFDPDADRLQASAAEIGATPYTDFDAFLASGIDVAIISSPMPVHAEQSIAALRAGKHVLCEVLACVTVAEARGLVAVAKESPGRYMLAENVNFYDEIELIKRLADQGRFGHIYYGEGDYTHSLQGLFFHADGSPTWRGLGGLTVYGSHGLGPLLYITGDRVAQVRATSLPGAIVDPRLTIPTMHLLDMTTDGGRVFRTRVDPVSFRPHESTTFFVVQGTHASYESIRGFGDRGKIWFRDQDEPVWYDTTGKWHGTDELIPHELPDRQNAPAIPGGHGTSEYWLLRSFFDALRTGADMPIDLHRGLDITLPCILAFESAARGGIPFDVPNSRDW